MRNKRPMEYSGPRETRRSKGGMATVSEKGIGALRGALTPAAWAVLIAYALYRLVAYTSYVTNFGFFADPLGYVSDLPFMIGAALGNFTSCAIVFALYATGRLRRWGLDCRSALLIVALIYLVVAFAPAPLLEEGVATSLLGVLWGLTVTVVRFAAIELLRAERSPMVLIVQLAVAAFLFALGSYGLRLLPPLWSTLFEVAAALVLVPLFGFLRSRLSRLPDDDEGAVPAADDGEGRAVAGQEDAAYAGPAGLARFRRTLAESSTPILAASFFELVCGLVNMYASCAHASFAISAQVPLEGSLVCSVLVIAFVALTARVPHSRFMYLVVFPGAIAVFLALPYFGEVWGRSLGTVIYSAYSFTAMLSMFCVIRACRRTGDEVYGIAAFMAAATRLCLMVGLALGWHFGNLREGSTFLHLSIVCVTCVYVLGMVLLLWGFRSSREKRVVKVVEVIVEQPPATFEEFRAARVEELTERYDLSPRERDVLVGLAQGNTAASIAEGLCISTSTAQGYIKSLYVKLGVNKKQQVIDLFQR